MGKLNTQFAKDVQERGKEILAHRYANQEAFIRVYLAENPGVDIKDLVLVEEQVAGKHEIHWYFIHKNTPRIKVKVAVASAANWLVNRWLDIRVWLNGKRHPGEGEGEFLKRQMARRKEVEEDEEEPACGPPPRDIRMPDCDYDFPLKK